MFVFTECELLAQYEMVGVTELFFFFFSFCQEKVTKSNIAVPQ